MRPASATATTAPSSSIHRANLPDGKGTFFWDGAAGTWFWVDPTNDIVFVGMIQRMTSPDNHLIARLLLGALMVFAGSNHLFNFLPKAPMPPGLAGQFLGAMMATGYMYIVGVCEVVPGLLLLVNRFVPLALTVLGAVIVNIFIVNLLMAPRALPIAIVVIILWVLAAYRVRTAFLPLLQQRVAD
jgi:putative oxidoreductase